MPARINRFVPDFKKQNGVRRVALRVPDLVKMGGQGEGYTEKVVGGDVVRKLRKVLVMGDPPPGVDHDLWIAKSVVEFANKAEKFCYGERDE
jgi:hypothetical protein